ncbi:MliC family protein [uncultured Roseobacter sp.]|uniref:MliC family protein n=1 Tax=uncultured Roseobacter sp. TaxID=114847 RepID=UPI0026355C43|nr:MliC family protein [uncultured Roseobacter sp.]
MLATPLVAQGTVQAYLCDRQVEVPVIYVAGPPAAVVLSVEGRLVYLESTPSASGARYAGTGHKSSYVWWSKGDAAMLAWFDAPSEEETPLYKQCTRNGR